MSSGGGQNWRGGRAPRNSSQQEEAVPSWKQSRHKTAAKSRPKGMWPKLRIALTCVVLIALVAIVIAFWDPQKIYRTHFIVLNLLEQSQDFDSGSSLALPEGIESKTTERVVTSCHPETMSLGTSGSGDRKNLDEGQTVVIWLQSTFVPGPNEDFLCLIRNSTPNLNDASQYVGLQTLKSELDDFVKKHSLAKLLLLVDSAPVNSEWRTGCLHSNLVKVFEPWTSEFKSLVIVLSSQTNGQSEPGPTGSDGKSIFGHFASVGLSTFADSNSDNKLTTTEYCTYISERTNAWVREHRDTAGQAVTVLPALEKLPKTPRDFTVVADLISLKPTDEMPAQKANANIAQIEKMWTRREVLMARGGHLWNPLLWNSLTGKLTRAEHGYLSGNTKAVERILPEAERTLREIETLTDETCPKADSFLADRGRALSEFNDLPSFRRAQQLFKTESVKADSTELPALPEDVVISVINKFPFASVSLNAPADIESIRSRRSAAEAAVAQLIACPDQLTRTVRRMESALLLSEDGLFTHHSDPGSASADEPDARPLILALEDFAIARDRAETTLFGVFDLAPTLARWAAETCFRLPDSDRKIWHSVLSQNTPQADVNGVSQNAMFDPLKGIAADDRFSLPDHERDAANLRAEAFRLLVRARALQQSLAFHEPENGFSAEELKATIDKLNLAQKDAASSQRQVLELIENVCTGAIGESSAKRVSKIRTRHFLRSALILTAIKADTRSKVLRTLQKWDDDLASPADGSAIDETPVTSTLPIVADEALWMLQILNVLPISSNQTETLSTAWNAAKQLEVGDGNQEHSAAAAFGNAIRKIWLQNQENVIAALQDTTSNSHNILRIADQQARLFSNFDTHSRTLQSPTARLHQLNRIQYCLMHADRILSGLWIEPNDAAPLLQNGWYARTSRLWLKAATQSVQALANEALGAPVSCSDSLRQLETRLTDSGKFHLTFQSEPGNLDLGEQAKVTGNINGSVTMIGCEGIVGEAAVLVPVAANSSIKVDHNAAGLRIGTNPVKWQLTFHRQGNPGTGECESLLFRPETFFRGRFVRSNDEISVNPCAPEEFTIQRSARPPKASLTVSGNDPRPVVLILDYSFSMTEPLTNKPGTARFEEALATLIDLVGGGNLNGSQVILNVYGHRVKYSAATDQMIENPLYANCFRKPIPPGLGALEDIETEFEGTIGKPGVQNSFNKTINNLRCSKPFGITPLIKAITNALDVSLQNSEGIVIVVTDGEASDLNNANKVNLLTTALKKKTATSVNIVAFDVAAQPAVRKKLQDTFAPFNIRVSDAGQRNQLFDQIVDLLGPRSYTVTGNNGLEDRTTALGTEVSELTPADDFKVSFSGVASESHISLQPGDVLKLDFDHTAKRFIYRRDKRSVSKAAIGGNLTNDSPERLKSIAPPRVADLPDDKDSSLGTAQLSLMLDHGRDELPVRQPAEIQFSVRPASSDSTYRPHVVHETYNSRTGAPGWDLRIDEWPKQQLFLVDAIWKMERTTPEYVLRWNELKLFDAIDNSFLIKQNGLPDCRAWITLRGESLEIRLDPVVTAPRQKQPLPLGEELVRNHVDNIRIEIGKKKDTSDQNKAFLPWEIDTKVIRLESGSVRYEFRGEQISSETLADAQIAFTSSAARKAGATEVQSFRLE